MDDAVPARATLRHYADFDFRPPAARTTLLAKGHPHGLWIEWLGGTE